MITYRLEMGLPAPKFLAYVNGKLVGDQRGYFSARAADDVVSQYGRIGDVFEITYKGGMWAMGRVRK